MGTGLRGLRVGLLLSLILAGLVAFAGEATAASTCGSVQVGGTVDCGVVEEGLEIFGTVSSDQGDIFILYDTFQFVGPYLNDVVNGVTSIQYALEHFQGIGCCNAIPGSLSVEFPDGVFAIFNVNTTAGLCNNAGTLTLCPNPDTFTLTQFASNPALVGTQFVINPLDFVGLVTNLANAGFGGPFTGLGTNTAPIVTDNPSVINIMTAVDGTAYRGEGTFTTDQVSNNPAPSTVPEPASLLLLGTGMIGVGYRRRKSRA